MYCHSAKLRSSRYIRVSTIASLLFVSLLVSACQTANDPTVPGGTPTTPSVVGNEGIQTTHASQTTEPSAIEVELELGPGSFDLTDPRVGLADLSNYEQKLVVSFQGTRDGQPHQWSQTQTLVHRGEPLESMLTIESSGDLVSVDPVAVAETTGVLYQSYRDGSCSGELIAPEDSFLLSQEPASLLSGLLGAEEAGTEPLNEVAALHYTFDERAMAESGRAETVGEVWIAVDGGQVLKYLRNTTANAAYFGGGVEGTITWAYDLTGLDEQSEIILPRGCQIDAPSMPEATNLQILPNWMGFDTVSAPADVTAFYQEQLPGRGWTPSGDPLIAPETEVTVYAKGDELLNVIAIAKETATRVDILLSAATE